MEWITSVAGDGGEGKQARLLCLQLASGPRKGLEQGARRELGVSQEMKERKRKEM